jgi:hypothetical protein
MVFQQSRLAIPSNTEYSVPQLRLLIEEVEAIVKRKITATERAGYKSGPSSFTPDARKAGLGKPGHGGYKPGSIKQISIVT